MRRLFRLIVKNWSLFLGIGMVCVIYTISGIGCPILYVTGIPCLGCGMSRALLCLLRLDFAGAIHYHPMSVLLPFLCGMWLYCFDKHNKAGQNIVLSIGVVMFIAVYLYRIFIIRDPVLSVDINNSFIYKIVYSIVEGRMLIW